MKRYIPLILISILITSCLPKRQEDNVATKPSGYSVNYTPINTYVIDGCEYVGSIYGQNNDWAAHKGNCKFCAKRNKTK